MNQFFRRIRYLLNRRRFDDELAEDMEFHREMAARVGVGGICVGVAVAVGVAVGGVAMGILVGVPVGTAVAVGLGTGVGVGCCDHGRLHPVRRIASAATGRYFRSMYSPINVPMPGGAVRPDIGC